MLPTDDLTDPASSAAVAPPRTTSFVTLTITMPYTKAEFGAAEQGKYKAAVVAASRTVAANVDIVSVTDTEGQRREGSTEVETKVMLSLPRHVTSVRMRARTHKHGKH